MKICSKCKVKKDICEFYTNNRSKDGLLSRCKDCHKELTKTTPEMAITRKLYRETNKQRLSESKKISYYKKQEKYKEDSRIYYHNNIEIIKLKNEEYRNNNKDKISDIGKIYRIKNKDILMKKQIIITLKYFLIIKSETGHTRYSSDRGTTPVRSRISRGRSKAR